MRRPQNKSPEPRRLQVTRSSPEQRNRSLSTEVILLAVTGMSPAILTETVWALAQENPPQLPDRIVVLTTTTGKEHIIHELFTPQPHFNNQSGWDCLLEKLQEHGHNTKGRLRFDPDSDDLHVLTRWEERSRRKRLLTDIRTRDESEAVADDILEFVRGIVEKPDTRLIASIAGGRKTMGTLLYACLTLIGRETDRITHVLVDEPFDDPRLQPRFYFPQQPQAELTTPQRRRLQAKEARIALADLPFVPVRNLFTKDLGRLPGGFLALVAQCSNEARRRAAADLRLVLHRSQPIIEVNGTAVELSAREQLLILFLADRADKGEPPFGSYKDGIGALNGYQEKTRREAPDNDFSDWRWRPELNSKLDEDDIRRLLNTLRGKLRSNVSDPGALLDNLPKARRLSLDLRPNQITFTA